MPYQGPIVSSASGRSAARTSWSHASTARETAWTSARVNSCSKPAETSVVRRTRARRGSRDSRSSQARIIRSAVRSEYMPLLYGGLHHRAVTDFGGRRSGTGSGGWAPAQAQSAAWPGNVRKRRAPRPGSLRRDARGSARRGKFPATAPL